MHKLVKPVKYTDALEKQARVFVLCSFCLMVETGSIFFCQLAFLQEKPDPYCQLSSVHLLLVK
jgi:hypothetical protein